MNKLPTLSMLQHSSIFLFFYTNQRHYNLFLITFLFPNHMFIKPFVNVLQAIFELNLWLIDFDFIYLKNQTNPTSLQKPSATHHPLHAKLISFPQSKPPIQQKKTHFHRLNNSKSSRSFNTVLLVISGNNSR